MSSNSLAERRMVRLLRKIADLIEEGHIGISAESDCRVYDVMKEGCPITSPGMTLRKRLRLTVSEIVSRYATDELSRAAFNLEE